MYLDSGKFSEFVDVNDPKRLIYQRVLDEFKQADFHRIGKCDSVCQCREDDWLYAELSVLDDDNQHVDDYHANLGVKEHVRIYLCRHCGNWSIHSDSGEAEQR